MPWWAWIILGAVLLGAEVVIAADFYLVFFGVSALIVGLVVLAGLVLPLWAEWLVFAALAVFGLVFYRKRLRDKLSKPDRELDAEIIGETAVATQELAPGALGQIELRGSTWKVRNDGDEDLKPGDRCKVMSLEGLVLHVRRVS